MLNDAQRKIRPGTILLIILSVLPVPHLLAEAPLTAPPGMALLPGGVYRPLFRAATEPEAVTVRAFYLDQLPVTTGNSSNSSESTLAGAGPR